MTGNANANGGGTPLYANAVGATLVRSDFDEAAFGVPYFRVTRFVPELLRAAIADVRGKHPALIVDAKLPAEEVAAAAVLLDLGFRKVCMQLRLERPLAPADRTMPTGAAVHDRLDLSEEVIARHAAGFETSRFALDPLLADRGWERMYRAWFRNSLGGRKRTATCGDAVCTFAVVDGPEGRMGAIDLVSSLTPRKGEARTAVGAMLAASTAAGATKAVVVTETENRPAWTLYQSLGFVPVAYMATFHLVRWD